VREEEAIAEHLGAGVEPMAKHLGVGAASEEEFLVRDSAGNTEKTTVDGTTETIEVITEDIDIMDWELLLPLVL
jgi:hypothetical protein